MIEFFLVLVSIYLIWYYSVKPMNYFKRLGIKQYEPWPLIGDNWHLMLKRKSSSEFVEYLYNRHPHARYTGYYPGSKPVLLIRDPELIKQITVKDFDHFTDHVFFANPAAEPLWAANLFALKGPQWKEMRGTLSGSFTSSKMKNMFGLINDTAENFIKYFMDKTEDVIEMEMKDTFTRFTNDVIATTAFGIKVDSLKEPENTFYLMGKSIANFGFLTRIRMIAYFMMPRIFKLFKIAVIDKNSTKYFHNIIQETIETRNRNGIVRQDMINVLLETRKEAADVEKESSETGFVDSIKEMQEHTYHSKVKNLSNEDITAQALIFFLAGFDTVSTALCFGSYELALNQEIQEKLRREIQETSYKQELTYEILLKMKYLDAVISEILRKWAPVVMIDRICTKPYTIEPINPEERPVKLLVGDVIILPFHGIQRDPEFYPEPEKFDPERFYDETRKDIRPYTYLPFGSGPRSCIGSRFAILEIKTLFYHLLLNFKIVPVKQTPVPLVLEKGSIRHTAEGGFWLGLERINK